MNVVEQIDDEDEKWRPASLSLALHGQGGGHYQLTTHHKTPTHLLYDPMITTSSSENLWNYYKNMLFGCENKCLLIMIEVLNLKYLVLLLKVQGWLEVSLRLWLWCIFTECKTLAFKTHKRQGIAHKPLLKIITRFIIKRTEAAQVLSLWSPESWLQIVEQFVSSEQINKRSAHPSLPDPRIWSLTIFWPT